MTGDLRSSYPGSFGYCSNPEHSFVYSSSFVYASRIGVSASGSEAAKGP